MLFYYQFFVLALIHGCLHYSLMIIVKSGDKFPLDSRLWTHTFTFYLIIHYCALFRDQFYQFGEIRTITIVNKQQCAFVQYTTRSAAEQAAEKTFNKLIIGGRRLNIKWGKSQGQQGAIKRDGEEEEYSGMLEPVPGLPGSKLLKKLCSILNLDSNYISKY